MKKEKKNYMHMASKILERQEVNDNKSTNFNQKWRGNLNIKYG